ncbi:hypothetical protein JXD20_02350 [Candidatus Peregrinibacteria bacterium]|nr:hypothetical protein [Candidatus Peregrinibacteria bacterium]
MILDNNDERVDSSENMGTFDFGTPLSAEHYILDIEPWLIWGNSPNDTTTYEDRKAGLGSLETLYYEMKLK